MDINDFIKELEYELRMLIGSAQIVELLKKHKTGNIINYYKDSVYLHARNLYNFFSANKVYDARVTDYGGHGIFFDMSVYRKWFKALHTHVLHINTGRTPPVNVIKGEHLNDQTKLFSDNIVGLWESWIGGVSDSATRKLLQDNLDKAKEEANNDCESVKRLLT